MVTTVKCTYPELVRHNGHPKLIHYVAIDIPAGNTKGISDNFGAARLGYEKFCVTEIMVEACDQVWKVESPVNWTVLEAKKWEGSSLFPVGRGGLTGGG